MPKNQPTPKNGLDIVIYILSLHDKRLFEPDYPELNPVGGSETAALRMAKVFQSMGHNVRILVNEAQLSEITCDVFISLRVWQVFQTGLFPGKVNYLWCQDDFDQPLVENLRIPEISLPIYQHLNGLFLLSHYQQIQWINNLNVPVEKIIPTTNGIPLEKFHVKKNEIRQRKPWAYYSSTPFRGLSLLLQAWPSIHEAIPMAELFLFTSMKVYNVNEQDDFTQLYETARTLPGVNYRGSVGQAELRETALKCRALAYPCIFPETSCIAAMEAMAAGCAVVGTGIGALIETAWQNPLTTPIGDWLPIWANTLIKVLSDDDEYERLSLHNLDVSKYYDWPIIARRWEKRFLEDLSSGK